jgi:hypothetical protein
MLHFSPNSSKAKVERALQKETGIKVATVGTHPNQDGILDGAIGVNHTPVRHSGTPLLKGRVKEEIREKQTQALYGVTSTKNLVIRPIGASTTLIVQADQHLTQKDYGARLVIDKATLPLLALPPLSALLPKEKENNRVVKANMVIGCGKAKTSPPTTILTKPLQPYTRNLFLPLHQAGGTIKN